MLLSVGAIVVGLVVLILGAHWLVTGSSRLALAVGISPLVVGLTVVAFGTSAPELAVSVTAASLGQSELAVANVIGSNNFNTLVVLGLSALVAPLVVNQQLVRMDVPIALGLSVLLLVLSMDGRLDVFDSALLAGLIVAYTGFLIAEARREGKARARSEEAPPARLPINLLLIAVGLVALVAGARFLVQGAVEIARFLGVSEVIIGLTIVAAGTSLPELATSVMAAYRGQRDLAIGNVVGSNIFNIGSVLGFSGLAAAGKLVVAPSMVAVELPLMIGVALLCLPLFRAGYRVTRANGAVLLGSYGLYLGYLVLAAQQSAMLARYQALVLGLVVPALIIGVVVVMVKSLRDEQRNVAG